MNFPSLMGDVSGLLFQDCGPTGTEHNSNRAARLVSAYKRLILYLEFFAYDSAGWRQCEAEQ